MARRDENDLIFKTIDGKFKAVAEDIKERHAKGQPVLVGTIAVETSEYLSELLKRQGVPHNVLNAKEHAREAEIIKDAGREGAVTIATNMAGRGVDIKIDDRVRELGGLYVLGTERHESRRIDNQLRGRSGRQGDPGETRFYLSGQDDLVRLFAGDRLFNIMERFKVPDDQPMDQKILSNQIENAQKKVEEQNFVQRKNVLKYDDVMNVQRLVIYDQRRAVLEGQDLSEQIKEDWLHEAISDIVAEYTGPEIEDDWPLEELVNAMEAFYGTGVTAEELRGLDQRRDHRGVLRRRDRRLRRARARDRGHPRGADARPRALHGAAGRRRPLARAPREHGLPARGHPPPRHGPERPARRVPERGAHPVPGAEPRHPRRGAEPALPRPARAWRARGGQRRRQRRAPAATDGGNGNGVSYQHETTAGSSALVAAAAGAAPRPARSATAAAASRSRAQPVVKSEQESVGRNDPCWCGSGKKYKRCHGA